MKIVGIVVEYNPFHNGHILHINETLKQSKADLLVAVMSPNYCMRGDMAVASKISRAKVALNHGVDCVLELPLPYALNSADIFSYGAIKTLNNFGVDEIYFGSESNDIETLNKIVNLEDNLEFNNKIKDYLSQGYSYPKSYASSIKDILNIDYSSNDLLGIKYLSAIKKINPNIKAFTIKRLHSNYQDTTANHNSIASATSIRLMKDKSNYLPPDMNKVINNKSLEEYYPTIKHLLLTRCNTNIFLVSEGIENYLKAHIEETTLKDFVYKTTNKRYSSSRIKRTLVNILLNVTKNEITSCDLLNLDYFRVLKMNEKTKNHLNSIKKDNPYKIVTNYKNVPEPFKSISIRADKIYSEAEFLKELKDVPYKK